MNIVFTARAGAPVWSGPANIRSASCGPRVKASSLLREHGTRVSRLKQEQASIIGRAVALQIGEGLGKQRLVDFEVEPQDPGVSRRSRPQYSSVFGGVCQGGFWGPARHYICSGRESPWFCATPTLWNFVVDEGVFAGEVALGFAAVSGPLNSPADGSPTPLTV